MYKPENPIDYLQGQIDFISFFCSFWAGKMPMYSQEFKNAFLEAYHSMEEEPEGDYKVGLEELFTRISGEKEIPSQQAGWRHIGNKELQDVL